MQRVIQAGAKPVTALSVMLEWQRDWAHKDTYDAVMDIVKNHCGAYGVGVEYAYTMVHGARDEIPGVRGRPGRARVMREEPVTVVVRRSVRPGAEAEFESAMRDFVQFALAFPGNRGIHVLRSSPREYTVVDRFADARSRQAFKASPTYRESLRRLRALVEADPYMEEQTGLGGWFTLPGAPRPSPAAQLKMAVVTFLGVLPLTAALLALVSWLLPTWHPQAANVVISVFVVTLLTWPVMPLLTRLFGPWLYGKSS